jgi:hypothetical protein
MKRTFILAHDLARANAKRAIDDAPAGHWVTLSEPRKSRAQEEKYHAMFGDIARQVPANGIKLGEESMKRALVSAFKIDTKDDPDLSQYWREMAEMKMFVGFRGEIVLDGDQTRRLPKPLASALIEWLFAFGAEHGVKWTDPAERRAA